MIFDTLDNYFRYSGLSKNLTVALDYLRETDLAAWPVGRIEIDGDNLYALIQEYVTRPVEQGKWEAHRAYIDVHYLLTGQERIGFANIRNMQLGEYLAENDFQPLDGPGHHLDIFPGSFVIFFPEDGHQPGLCITVPQQVRKVVLKVKIDYP